MGKEIQGLDAVSSGGSVRSFEEETSFFSSIQRIWDAVRDFFSFFFSCCIRPKRTEDESMSSKEITSIGGDLFSADGLREDRKEERVSDEAGEDKDIPVKESVVLRFAGDLTKAQKKELTLSWVASERSWQPAKRLDITFSQHPEISFAIQVQDIFESRAQVIVNETNRQFVKGKGIDAMIYEYGGPAYAEGYDRLREKYNGKYTEGYAAMIGSGSLENAGFENVIVVLGPQAGGYANPRTEGQLYSCYFNALELAHEQGKESIVFPLVGTGRLDSFPRKRAAAVSLKAVYDFVNKYPDTQLKTISICVKGDLEDYRSCFED